MSFQGWDAHRCALCWNGVPEAAFKKLICVKDHPTLKRLVPSLQNHKSSSILSDKMLVTRCDLNGMQWHLVGFQPTRFLQKQRNADPVEPLKDFSGTKMMAVLKRSPKMVSWIEPCQTFDNEFSVKSCCSWEMEDLIVQCKCKKVSEVKWLPSCVRRWNCVFWVCTLWSAMNGTCLMPGMFVALNKWPQSWQSLEQQNLSCKNAFPSPLCTLEPGWNYGPFTRCWLFVQKARLQSGGFQRPSWLESTREKPQDGSPWVEAGDDCCPTRHTSPDMGCGRSTEEWGKKTRFGLSVLKLPKNETFGMKWWKFHFGYQICWSHLKFWKIETEYHHKLASSTHVTTLCYEACFLCRR